MHEASLHDQNCSITLTYSSEHVPYGGTLMLSDFQRFMKRLRKRFGNGIRFYHCGEYGENFGRPHYHAILFNHDFPDKRPWRFSNNELLYRSQVLEELWPFGFSSIGSVTFESAAYVARYILKKINGELADTHYTRINPDTGEYCLVRPEYVTMSRRPGIASGWFDKFSSDVYPSDEVIVRGHSCRPPRFYDNRYELLDPDQLALIKNARKKLAKNNACDNTPDRLCIKEELQSLRLSKLIRPLA